MPYINQDRRMDLIFFNPENAGELNYQFTLIAKQYVCNKGESYQTYNDIIGALECCKQELYRKKIGIYENQKEVENGTVW